MITILAAAVAAVAPLPDLAAIAAIFEGDDFVTLQTTALPLPLYGKRLFPEYHYLVNSERYRDKCAASILHWLSTSSLDAAEFRHDALSLLNSGRADVRYAATLLLGKWGNSSDTSALFACMATNNHLVCLGAAQAVSKIGTKQDLAQFDIWLHSGHRFTLGPERSSFEQCRSLLHARVNITRK